ncbi:TRAP transporter permease [Amycolatopsis palatopharyngis]|uniref:TRAP transporter permease n=1 Tax=Amycolatopsis palatopharyngis TaxID=187982 RepID=UPI000E23B938|nr:TRAP transporter permease [Amycolatopsis palatopharyngis]
MKFWDKVVRRSVPDANSPDGDESAGRVRDLGGLTAKIVTVIAVVYSGYYLWTAQFGIVSPQAHRGFYWGFAGLLVFLLYPVRKRRKAEANQRVPIWDIALALTVVGLAAYYVFQYPEIVARGGTLTDMEYVLGILAVVLSLEMTRRVLGTVLPGLGVLAIVYTFFGPSMPGFFAHAGYDAERFLTTMYTSFNGLFGPVADIFATYVFIFIIFGAFLQKSGAGQFFVDLPLALAGTRRGGPAKVAIAVSALMGSVNGSVVANVMTTGSVTIPLMRRVGYTREFAGGVEAAASVGGQVLPPVMGAGAFLIAEFTQTSYSTIMLVSIVPALMYFFAVYLLVDFESVKRDLRGVPRSELPDWRKVLKQGWYFVLPLVLLFVLVVMRFSPAFAGFWAVVAVVVIGVAFPYNGSRMGIRSIVQAMRNGAVASLAVGAIVGTIGIVIGVVNLTGLGLRFSDLVVQMSGGSLLLALVLTALASWFLGAGLTVTSSYIMVAVLVAPALTDLGLSLVVAHLVIFWVSQDANVTPPIALGAFAGASISGGSPMRTAWQAWLLARGLYIVPFLMAYTPLIDGPWTAAAPVVITAMVGIYGLTAGFAGHMRRKTTVPERLLLLVGGGLLIAPGMLSNGIGLAILVAVYVLQRAFPEAGKGSPAAIASEA